MKTKVILAILIVLSMLITSVGFADDGTIFRRNISKTPDLETERANINHMSFYVPAQNSMGDPVAIEYYDALGALHDTRDYAKPLVAVYIDEFDLDHELGSGGAGMGHHDAHAALSLDDGATWKRTNLSMSADLSSFTLHDGTPFPGDAHNMTFAIAGDKVLVGWISKYCDGGSPTYTLTDDDADLLLGVEGNDDLGDLYVTDIWGVAGAQKSVDYTLQGFPEVGEIPYSCVWSARGQLLALDDTPADGPFDIVWTKAERLTSGRRDANRLEMNADGAAGFMMTWQEDPDGLRPGQGLGPGEGWSGAVVNQQTDLWYSYIAVDDFNLVDQDGDINTVGITLQQYLIEGDGTLPKVAVPMAMPARLTDNKMCKATPTDFPYCYVDFDIVDAFGNVDLPDDLPDSGSTESDLCADQLSWTNPNEVQLNLCVAEDGRVMAGRVGASRPRVNVQPYDSDGDGTYDAAWVIMGAEESKALGEGSTEEDVEPEDIGKNMWYYTFDLVHPAYAQQGGMLNQPAVCTPGDATAGDCTEGEFYPLLNDNYDGDANAVGPYDYEFYETEIARRFSHFSQPIHQIGEEGVSAVLIVKQGILNQGGPADIFLRRLVVPEEEWVDCPADSPYEKCLPADYNPYAYENMACDQWVYTDGSNPRYVEGLCLDNMINVSGGTIVSCEDGSGGADCAAQFPWDGGVSPFPKVTEWRQCDGTSSDDGCEEGDNDLDDQSWENPFDVAKGHRGFIDGDFIMMMYAWSPNWKANSVGNDHYNLYARRSFDGGATWTTTPVSLGGDGTCTTENFGTGEDLNPVETCYGAGEFEQARNLSQLTGNRETILDPRYTPTGGIKMLPITDLKEIGFEGYEFDDFPRDPSKFFIVYETGDNTTVAEGEAVPLDLFYSRAFNWGDDYDLAEYEKDGEIVLSFDWLEHDREDLSGEAGNTCNNGGTFYYAIWNQWQEDEHENVSESDATFRRIMYIDDEDLEPTATILYQSTDMADYDDPDIILIGSGKDNDHLGEGDQIIEARWWVDDDEGNYFEGRTFQHPPNGFIPGKHDFSFKVQDNEGRWSRPKTVTIWIAYQFYDTYLPLVTR